MKSPYPDFSENGSTMGHVLVFNSSNATNSDINTLQNPLIDTAHTLFQSRKHLSRLSPLVFMTDPKIVSDPLMAAQRLPLGSAIIYRHFGAVDKLRIAQNLRQITMERRQQLLIGNDPELALDIGADGVHFRRDDALIAPSIWRKHYPKWIITMAGLKGDYLSYTAPLNCLDGLFVSSVFKSDSPTATDPIESARFKHICDTLDAPIFALGGVNIETAPKLIGSGAAGLAGIRGILSGMPTK